MTTKIEGKGKKIALLPEANPVRKLYEYLLIMALQDTDYYDVDLEHVDVAHKLKLTRKIKDFINLRANEDLIIPQRKLLLSLLEIQYVPKSLNISDYLHAKRIFDIASESWVRVRIEIFSMLGMPHEDIYSELRRLGGKELYSLKEIRTYIYFFWNFSYQDGWEDDFREGFCKYFKSDKLLSEFYSKSLRLLTGEIEPYDLLIELGFSDEKGDFRRGVLNKAQRRMESNMLKASEENNPAEAISWQRSQLMMNKLMSLPYSGNEGVILPIFTKFKDPGKISKITILNKRKGKKIGR